MEQGKLLEWIKQEVHKIEPQAEIILYGSRSRRDAGPDADWDFLVLVEGPVSAVRADAVRHNLYPIEWESGEVLSVVVRSRQEWNSPRFRAMPFRQNVVREGVVL